MSAFKQKAGRLGVRAGVLAGASAAILAISGLGATSALAAPECGTGTPANIQGQGSSLQRIAQQELTGREVTTVVGSALPHTKLSPERGYAKECGTGKTTVSYTSTSSGKGLTAFRFNGTGSIENGGTEPEKGYAFVGSDDGPNAAQIENAEKATTGGIATGANPLIIPVAQTAIAVPIHLPASCAFTAEKGLTYANLNAIFNGKMKLWSEVANLTGAGCTGNITRVVRAEGSGTTYQFKNYLQSLQTGQSAVGPECGTTNWSELEEIGTEEKPNISWPECEISSGNPRIAVVKKAGGGEVANYVATTAGTIGYAALPDAKSKSATVARLEDKGGATPAYALPEAETGEKANCGTRVYTVPTPGREGETGESVNWSKVFGASPEVGGALYPLCTLTYDISWTSYEKAGYSNSANIAADVKKYINYVLSEGQTTVNSHYYQKLPSPASASENVLAAAKLAASKIG